MISLVLALNVNTATPEVPPVAFEQETVDIQRMNDLDYAVQAMERLAARVAALPEAERRPYVGAVTDLATNCPYNRATFMLVLTLERELDKLDPSTLGKGERARFEVLVRGVKAHTDLLRSLGADALPDPIPGDYLFGSLLVRPHALPDGFAFAASEDPIAETKRVFDLVPEVVSAMPEWTRAQVKSDWHTLAGVVGHEDTLFMAIGRWASEFEALAPSLGRGQQGEQVERLSALLRTHAGQGC